MNAKIFALVLVSVLAASWPPTVAGNNSTKEELEQEIKELEKKVGDISNEVKVKLRLLPTTASNTIPYFETILITVEDDFKIKRDVLKAKNPGLEICFENSSIYMSERYDFYHEEYTRDIEVNCNTSEKEFQKILANLTEEGNFTWLKSDLKECADGNTTCLDFIENTITSETAQVVQLEEISISEADKIKDDLVLKLTQLQEQRGDSFKADLNQSYDEILKCVNKNNGSSGKFNSNYLIILMCLLLKVINKF